MERWLQAAARYEEVASSGSASTKRAGSKYASLRSFAESEDFSAALRLLSASGAEIVLADEPVSSLRLKARKKLERQILLPDAPTQRIILDKDGFKLVRVFLGSISSMFHRPPDVEIKPPRLLSAQRALAVCRAFDRYRTEDVILWRILSRLDELSAYAP